MQDIFYQILIFIVGAQPGADGLKNVVFVGIQKMSLGL